MEHGQHHHHPHGNQSGYHDGQGNWADGSGAFSQAQQQPLVQEYPGYGFSPLPIEPLLTTAMHPPRTATHQQLQPLIMPQWPSMLTSQSTYVPPIFPTAPVPVTPVSAPASATSTRPISTPRRTLTDADRRRMCLYHEENPNTKQTEIGAMFGVERSTVSKVLRQKEKYLYQEDGSRSPVKRSKGKFPDIERALSNWARNHVRQGLPLSDAMIREKARFFAATVGNPDGHLKTNSSNWLEKFRLKNNLTGSGSRKNSLATEDSEDASNPASNSHTPNGISPISPRAVASPSPVALSAAKSDDSIKTENSDQFDYGNGHKPFHSQSNTSLSSVFTDTAPSTFSGGPTSPLSPFFTPDSACGPSPFLPSQQSRAPLVSQVAEDSLQRPRSQTFPTVGVDPYISPPSSSEPLTPKYLQSTALDSPLSELQNPLGSVGDTSSQAPPTASSSQNPNAGAGTVPLRMQPPPVPTPSSRSGRSPASATASISSESFSGSRSPAPPSQEDAQRALELVMDFCQLQPSGFFEPQEFVTIGKLMEKLKLQRPPGGVGLGLGLSVGVSPGGAAANEPLPGGMVRMNEGEFGVRRAEGA